MYSELKIRGQELHGRMREIMLSIDNLDIYAQLNKLGFRHEMPCYNILKSVCPDNVELLCKALTYDNKLREYKELCQQYFNAPRG